MSSWKQQLKVNAIKYFAAKSPWSGNYPDWQTAEKLGTSYDADNILEKVRQATLKVKNGEAAYERDSVLFDQVEYSFPLLSAILFVAAQNGGTVKVLDFGGALGSSYFQNKLFLDKLPHVEWSVIEQPSFVTCGRRDIQDNILQFFYSVEEAIEARQLPDILITSCTLPYLEQPYEMLEKLSSYHIPYLFIDNTVFNRTDNDRICLQKVPNSIYEATLPCWLLSYTGIKTVAEKRYQLLSEHQNDSFIYLDGHKIQFKGFLGMLKP